MVCPFCMTGFKDDDSVKFCPECGIPHHEACWQKNKGCTTIGCSGQYNEAQITKPTETGKNCGAALEDGHASGFEYGTKNNSPAVNTKDPFVKPGKKLTKKQIIIGAAALAAVIIVAIVLISSIPSELDRVREECTVEIGAFTTGSGNSFTIDTIPHPYTNMEPATADYLRARAQNAALNAIAYANKEFGFGFILYNKMLNTTALMGQQSEENSKYRVTWTYHPDEGLIVTYTRQ